MNVTIAILVTTDKKDGETRYVVQTLSAPILQASDALVKTALNRLSQKVRQQLQKWLESGNTQAIDPWLYDPDAKTVVFKQPITLKDRTVKIKTLVIEWERFGTRFGFAPLLDELTFQMPEHGSLVNHAKDAIHHWCEAKVRDDKSQNFAVWNRTGEMWIEPLDFHFDSSTEKRKNKNQGRIGALLGQSNPGGAETLQRVGRCLDTQYSSHSKLFGRDREADRLNRLLSSKRRQGVLLIGASGVGKSSVLEEVVRRRALERPAQRKHEKQVWLISPGRVISGMSYLGQWEQRWLSLLREARKRDHVLYFDDPIGLFTAGMTRDSDLCLADVLKAFVSEHPLRMVWELTGEALSILRRKDRTLADQMVPVSIEPMTESATLRAMIEVVAQIEVESKCFVNPSLIPAMLEKASIVSPDQVMPGRVVSLVRGLANQCLAHSLVPRPSDEADEQPARTIQQDDLNRFVEQRTGLRSFLRMGGVDHDAIVRVLEHDVVGQKHAVSVLASYALRSIERLAPTDRPQGVFLFTGPTGVGKTESAKALTRFLFHDESRLVRIDLNEVTSAEAAQGLIGTMEHPDGRLPSAIRRQPHCVLLLDEIEKAHPDVLDYLLQVIGEGRLSDARGRTVDFRSAFIIMTSNLGAQHSNKSLGYDLSDETAAGDRRAQVFLDVAKRTFRPEFLNRIDEIVVFHRLERQHMFHIVDHHLEQLRQRDGLSRRRIFLQQSLPAMEHIVDRGFDEALGARAIKRAVEREVTQPLADQLASVHVDNPVWIRLGLSENKIQCSATELFYAKRRPCPPYPTLETTLDLADQLVERLSQECEARYRSESSESRLSQVQYYVLRDAIGEVIEQVKSIREELAHSDSKSPVQPIRTTNQKVIVKPNWRTPNNTGDRQAKTSDLKLLEGIASLADSVQGGAINAWTLQVCRLATLAESISHSLLDSDCWLVRCGTLNDKELSEIELLRKAIFGQPTLSIELPHRLTTNLAKVLRKEQYQVTEWDEENYFVAEGTGVSAWIKPILGTYQSQAGPDGDYLFLIDATPLPQDWSRESIPQWLSQLVDPRTDLPRASVGNVDWRIIRGRIGTELLDLSTEFSTPLSETCDAKLRDWIIDLMPWPREFEQELHHVPQ
jgi:ATP-dependent Clp protease ATP-binding subunit ClpC